MNNNSNSHSDNLQKLQMEYEKVRATEISRTAFAGLGTFAAVGLAVISGLLFAYYYYSESRYTVAALQQQAVDAREQLRQAQDQIAQLRAAIEEAQTASTQLQTVAKQFSSLKQGLETWHPTISQGSEIRAEGGGNSSQCPPGTYATGVQALSSSGGPHGIIYGASCRMA